MYDKDRIYKEALNKLPNSPELNGNYALFLHHVLKNYDEAEKYYKRALELDPNEATCNVNYALFLTYILKKYDEAEKYYKRAIELDPNSATKKGKYAVFLKNIRKNYEASEKYYKEALELDPNHVDNNSSYALFLYNVRKDYAEAEKHFKRACEADMHDANNNANYAGFLLGTGRSNEAIKYIEEAEKNYGVTALKAELEFYKYTHFPEKRKESLRTLKSLLCSGVRAFGFNPKTNMDRAIKEGHPDPELLLHIADVLTKDAPIGDLCKDKNT
jgi:Tfp pilus assembly protein PilF